MAFFALLPPQFFVGAFALAVGEDAAAGDGLAAGLGLFVGVLSVADAGVLDAAGAGVVAPVVFELLAGSQAAANAIEQTATSSSAARPKKPSFRLSGAFFIVFPSFQTRLKSGMIITRSLFGSNGRSHRCFAGISANCELKPSFSKGYLHE